MKKMDIVTEDLIAIRGKWDDASVKIVTQDKELEPIRGQLWRKIQELETKVHNEKTLLENQSKEVEDIRTMLDDVQTS